MSLVDAVGRSYVSRSSHHFITPFSAEFTHIQSSFGCVDNYVEQQGAHPLLEFDVFSIT
jgi:hypothetical protein